MIYFKKHEIECKGTDCCGGLAIYNDKHMARMDMFRAELGMPFEVTSWSRCVTHNTKVSGDDNSNHMYGRATDGIPTPKAGDRHYGLSNKQLLDYARMVANKVGFEEVIVYNNFIHLGTE